MSRSFICLRCRQNLPSHVAKRARINGNSRRSFISLRQPDETEEIPPPEPAEYSPSQGSLLGDHVTKKPPPKFSPLPRVEHALTDLFISKERIGPSVKSRYSKLLYPTREAPSEVPQLEPSQLEKDLASISEALIDADGDIADPLVAWRLFENSPSLQSGVERSDVDEQLLKDTPILTNLLMRIVRLRTRERRYREVTALHEVIHHYSSLGLMEGRWVTIIYRYIVTLIANAGNSRLNSDHDPVYVSRLSVLQDLCRLWKWFLGTLKTPERQEHLASRSSQVVLAKIETLIKQEHEEDLKGSVLDLRLPTISELFVLAAAASTELRNSLAAFCCSHRGQAEGKTIALAAFLTCHLVHSFERGPNHWNKIISDVDLHSDFTAHALYGRWLDKASINDVYPRMSLNYKSLEAIRSKIVLLRRESADPFVKMKAELNKASHERNVKYSLSLWRQFRETVATGNGTSEEQMELYSAFLGTFFELKQREHAIDVWNVMIQAEKQPGKEHWLIMLEGVMRFGDVDSLENIWQQMISAGIRPDNGMWKLYLQGLFKSRQWKRGLEALDDLGRAWELEASTAYSSPNEESKIDPTNGTQPQGDYLPDIGPINAAINGLLQCRRNYEVPKILDWAASHDLKPNVQTYRFLLLDAVRADDIDEVHQLLHRMETQQVAPSVEIFTILMDFAFRNRHSDFQLKSPAQQQEIVAQVLRDMEDAGIQADGFTYGTLLSGLLKPPCLNIVAARAVIEQMAEKGIPISPHIHTILVGYYFSQQPPDLAAIDSLWAKIQVEKHPVDHVFFDRMIEEYARIGELEKMLIFLRKMVASGKVPGWGGLCRILRALARAQEWEWVQDLLNDMVDERRLFRFGVRSPRKKDEFWALVDQIRARGVELPERPADLFLQV